VRLHFTSEFFGVVVSFRVGFSQRSWPYFLAVTLPWLVHEGQRSVRELQHGAGLPCHESGFYRFFSEFKFNVETVSKVLFDLIVRSFNLDKILIVVDDTLCPKWGHHIFGTASFFDHASRPKPGFIWGHNWVVLAIIVELFGVPVSIPFWVNLYRPKSTCPKREFQTRLEIAENALRMVKTWTSLDLSLVADGAYNNKSPLLPLKELRIPLISRLRSDACLRKDPPKPRRRRKGRPPKYGDRLPPLRSLARCGRGWKTLSVHIYGKDVTVRVKCFEAWWSKAGVKLRVVIVRDPQRRRKPCYLSSTDLKAEPERIIEIFATRWSIEQMISDAKNVLGLDSAEVRTEKRVLRHGTIAFTFLAMVRLWAARRFSGHRKPPVSFSKQLSFLRQEVIAETIFQSHPPTLRSPGKSRRLPELFAEKVPA
jgi:hypothetical protein